jgi:ribonucleoside-triphosphate reductase
MNIIKRDGSKKDFNPTKIKNAIMKAMKNGSGIVKPEIAEEIAASIRDKYESYDEISIYDVEKDVFDKLIEYGQNETARAYEGYRSIRAFQRQKSSIVDETMEMIEGKSEYWNGENSNKNPREIKVQRDYMAGILSTDITRRELLPPDIVQAHDDGIIQFHDMDYFAENAKNNCSGFNLEDMLQNGTVMNGKAIHKPHSLKVASTVTTQIITAVSSSQYGGVTISLTHLAPFVRISYEKIRAKHESRGLSPEQVEKFTADDLHEEIVDSVQTFNYQINTMFTVNGQAPFLSVFMYLGETDEYKKELAMLIEEFLKQRIEGMENQANVKVTQEFPKLLYVLEEDNITEDSPYWYLTVLAAKCSAKRLTPDYISEKKMKEYKNGDVYWCMGCRSFLTPDRFTDAGIGNIAKAKNYVPGKHKYYGRFNQGVVTLNLVDAALSSKGDENEFWSLMENRLELCHKALRCRHERLKGMLSDAAPILYQHGAFARLEHGEKIDELLYHGYSTISLGYAGLYECVKYMTGESHSSGKGHEFGIKVMKCLNDACAKWKAEEDIDYSVYGTPIETATYRFATKLKERFGVIEGITDHNYITNSYHVNVREKIDPFEKLKIEAEYQRLSPGGAISYVECSDLTHNIPAVLKMIQFIYDNIMYAELNTKSDYCQNCGYDGEIKIVDDNGKLEWECPKCGCRDHAKMNVARRTCGYIGSHYWNEGRTEEIRDRYVHLDVHQAEDL